jgi:endonuclease/exonuclease/phosphatase family metal-dependent hydrolase
MTIKLLQLNINSDNYWDILIQYLTSHDFDILQFQEVTGKDTIGYTNINAKRDGFEELKKRFKDKYKGELAIAQRYTSSPHSYMGNATFYRKEFTLLSKQEITLFHEQEYFPSDYKTGENSGRTMLHLTLHIENKPVSILNTHFAWGWDNIEKPHQTKQGKIIIDYLQKLAPPFIFSGDLNLTPDQPFIRKLDELARNLTAKNNINNTLNPKNHRAKVLFPKGLAVDYIFISKELQANNFAVIDEGLSDHFGLTAEIEI